MVLFVDCGPVLTSEELQIMQDLEKRLEKGIELFNIFSEKGSLAEVLSKDLNKKRLIKAKIDCIIKQLKCVERIL